VEFKVPYLLAMRERDPKLFMELRRSGKLDQHLQEKTTEAHNLLDLLLSGHPNPSLPQRREAQEQVFATLISFPPRDDQKPEFPGPLDDLPSEGHRGGETGR
jgi:hypothetical protein